MNSLPEEGKGRRRPEMKRQTEVRKVVKQKKNLTPDDSVKGQMWRKLTDNLVTVIRVEKCRQENWLEKERRLSVIKQPYR
jgi:hypothetical protein